MNSITIKDKLFIPFIEEKEIQDAVKKIARQINQDYQGKTPLFVAILNGSFMFFSDLLKQINFSCTISFVKLVSYEGMSSTGKVDELIGLDENIEGKDIVVVEDIVDTGNTLQKIYEILNAKNAKNIKIASLLYKPEVYKKEYPIDYVGIKIPNDFVVGYGLDYDGFGRNLSSIVVLKE